ncbi:MAG: M24 family metallopeptidase [Clostridiales Family XIII bacterium]|jgi:Xaa-Pro aminopeptidase|nr:M24 family metallopeptidase [Clostridiales Family XIII bacterium]
MNLDRYAPLISPTSEKELMRRRGAVQSALREQEVDCVLLYSSYLRASGAIRYFLDFPTAGTHALYGILPAEGQLSVFGHGHKGATTVPKSVAFDLELNYAYPFGITYPFTLRYIFDTVADYAKKKKFKNIGIYRRGLLPYEFVRCLADDVDGVTLTDVDEMIDPIMAAKSPEEIEYHKYAVELHDKIYAALPTIVRAGKREKDIANEIQKIATDFDCEGLNIMIGSGNPLAHHKHYFFQNRLIEEGDYIDLLVEVSGPGNYYGELSRMWKLGGDPSKEFLQLNEDSIKIQSILADAARPGVPASRLMEVLHAFQAERGYKLEDRFFGHGQGVDLVQRPLFDTKETMTLQENMFVSIHPALENDTIWAFNTDNYLITKDGAVRLNKTPQGIFVV